MPEIEVNVEKVEENLNFLYKTSEVEFNKCCFAKKLNLKCNIHCVGVKFFEKIEVLSEEYLRITYEPCR